MLALGTNQVRAGRLCIAGTWRSDQGRRQQSYFQRQLRATLFQTRPKQPQSVAACYNFGCQEFFCKWGALPAASALCPVTFHSFFTLSVLGTLDCARKGKRRSTCEHAGKTDPA